jgi:hypothetical protein
MSNGITKGNRPPFCGNSEVTRNMTNPMNNRTGKESVRLTQDYKKGLKSQEELNELR